MFMGGNDGIMEWLMGLDDDPSRLFTPVCPSRDLGEELEGSFSDRKGDRLKAPVKAGKESRVEVLT